MFLLYPQPLQDGSVRSFSGSIGRAGHCSAKAAPELFSLSLLEHDPTPSRKLLWSFPCQSLQVQEFQVKYILPVVIYTMLPGVAKKGLWAGNQNDWLLVLV